MPNQVPYLRVFISSPGDVGDERRIATEIIEALPDRPYFRDRVAFRIISWNRPGADTPMLATLTPQEAINQGLPKPSDCDIALVIFWARIGTKFVDSDGTQYESGTHWELMDALKNPNCETIIYRRTQDLAIEAEAADDEDQYRRMQAFFESGLFYQEDRILRGVNEYYDVDDFRQKFQTHLEEIVLRKLARLDAAAAEGQTGRTGAADGTDRNRAAMIENVQRFWIDGVLENALHHTPFIHLGLAERGEAVENAWNLTIRTGEGDQPLPPDTSITMAFRRFNGKLLILGEPGSGKTTLLLELTRALLENARQDLAYPIPVVFNLSSWINKRQPLHDWMIDELGARYQVPRRIAEPWVENEQILPLLDGLDEVEASQRSACVEAINSYRSAHGFVEMAVCSRVADYQALSSKLLMEGAIVLQPLSQPQIDDFLARGGTALDAVRHVLETDNTLAQLVTSPLMLNIITLAYTDATVNDLGQFDKQDDRRQHLFDMYVDQALRRRIGPARYTIEQTRHYLTTLAKRMVSGSQTVFYVEDLQPGWLHGWRQIAAYVVALPLLTVLLSLVYFLTPYAVAAQIALLSAPTDILRYGGQISGLLGYWVIPPILSIIITAIWRRRRRDHNISRVRLLMVFTHTLLIAATLWGIALAASVSTRYFPPAPVLSALVTTIPLAITAHIALRREQKTGRVAWIGILIAYLLTMYGVLAVTGLGLGIAEMLRRPDAFMGEAFVLIMQVLAAPAVVFGLYFSIRYLFKRRVEPIEAVRWSWSRSLLGGAVFGAISAGVGGIIVGGGVVTLMLFDYLVANLDAPDANDAATFIQYIQTDALSTSFLTGLLVGGIAGFLAGAAIGGLRGTAVDTRVEVNEGIQRSWRLGLFTGILSIVVIEIVTVVLLLLTANEFTSVLLTNRSLGWPILVLFLGFFVPFVGLVLGLSNGGYVAVQHVALRLILWRSGALPRDLPRFLTHAQERLLLYRVGGGYIFIHRMLLEHFASTDDRGTLS